MFWKKNPNENDNAPETFFISEAQGLNDVYILYDMWTVVHRMIERRDADHAETGIAIHLISNATNAFVDLVWLDDAMKSSGDWRYTIWYPKFYDIEHKEGAFHFDKQVRFAVFMLDEDYYGHCEYGDGFGLRPMDKYGDPVPDLPHPASTLVMPRLPLKFYLSTELTSEPELILV